MSFQVSRGNSILLDMLGGILCVSLRTHVTASNLTKALCSDVGMGKISSASIQRIIQNLEKENCHGMMGKEGLVADAAVNREVEFYQQLGLHGQHSLFFCIISNICRLLFLSFHTYLPHKNETRWKSDLPSHHSACGSSIGLW